MVSQLTSSSQFVSSPDIFFFIIFLRKPAHDRKHPHRKQF
jgi:hypothetical protein